VTFAPVVATWRNGPLDPVAERWISKPVSSHFPSSCQLKSICPGETAFAVRFAARAIVAVEEASGEMSRPLQPTIPAVKVAIAITGMRRWTRRTKWLLMFLSSCSARVPP
jgi:hypothetical protein